MNCRIHRSSPAQPGTRLRSPLCGTACGWFVDDLYASATAPGALQTALQQIEWEAFTAHPHQGLEIEFNRCAARVRSPAVATLRHRTKLQAVRLDAPAEPVRSGRPPVNGKP